MKFRGLIYFLLLIPFSAIEKGNETIENFGKASFYHDSFHGQETSNGEIYDKDDFTAAHRSYPFNTILLVTNKTNNKSVVVRINDRGPFVKSRVIDLSHAAAKKIGMVPFGVAPVKIKVLNFLNPNLMNGKLLNDGEVWDCYGKKKKLKDMTIFMWRTTNWKHAFYMASLLSLEFKLNSLFVKVVGPPEKRFYDLIDADPSTENDSKELLSMFKSYGFFHAHLSFISHSAKKPHAGQRDK